MWGRRKKRRAQLPRQLALGLLEDAMGRVQQPQEHDGEPATVRYPGTVPDPATRPGSQAADLRAADVPVDNSAAPDRQGPAGTVAPRPGELPRPRTGDSTRHGTFG